MQRRHQREAKQRLQQQADQVGLVVVCVPDIDAVLTAKPCKPGDRERAERRLRASWARDAAPRDAAFRARVELDARRRGRTDSRRPRGNARPPAASSIPPPAPATIPASSTVRGVRGLSSFTSARRPSIGTWSPVSRCPQAALDPCCCRYDLGAFLPGSDARSSSQILCASTPPSCSIVEGVVLLTLIVVQAPMTTHSEDRTAERIICANTSGLRAETAQ